jgi:hypothetical protein
MRFSEYLKAQEMKQSLSEDGDLNNWSTKDGIAALRPQSVNWEPPEEGKDGVNIPRKRRSKKKLNFSRKK